MEPTPARAQADAAQQRADRLKTEADRANDTASALYGRFAGGQPLLVGHHSYRSALRDRARADNATRRAIEKQQEAQRAQAAANKAKNLADLATVEATQTRPWQRSDFRPGDIVEVRDFRRDSALTGTYRVKRANAKTLTLEAPCRGFDDPKRTYDRVLSRTRDGITITNPADGDADAHPAPQETRP